MAFIGLIPEGMEVNHKNGIKTDNSIDNLEIVTPSENTLHAVVLGLHVPPRGVITGNAKLNDSKVQMILADPNKSCNSFSKELGVSPTLISAIRKRKLCKHIHDNDYGGGARVDGLEPSA